MRIERMQSPRAAEVRALWPPAAGVADDVAAIIAQVREGGDAALRELAERFDPAGVAPDRLSVPGEEVEAALGWAEPELIDAMRVAVENVRAVADAQVAHGTILEIEPGQIVDIAEVPVRRAGIYVPAGRAPYPSTVIMAAITARAAGVAEIAVCTPPSVADARVHPLILRDCIAKPSSKRTPTCS